MNDMIMIIVAVLQVLVIIPLVITVRVGWEVSRKQKEEEHGKNNYCLDLKLNDGTVINVSKSSDGPEAGAVKVIEPEKKQCAGRDRG